MKPETELKLATRRSAHGDTVKDLMGSEKSRQASGARQACGPNGGLGKLRLAAVATAAFCGLVSAPAMASAQQRVFRGVVASSVYLSPFPVSAGFTVTLETRNLSAGADTVMNILSDCTRAAHEVAYNDDSGGTWASKIVYTNTTSSTQSLCLLVYAYAPSSQGTADIYWNGSLFVPSISVAGAKIYVPCSDSTRLVQMYIAVPVANGPVDTMLFALTNTNHFSALDDDGGAGLGSAVGGPWSNTAGSFCPLIVALYGSQTPGPVNVYVNDISFGSDNDGLGSALEAQLGTCDSKSQSSFCAGVFNTQDTDRDGIDDFHEVFGIDDVADPLYLQRWGANPLHKDVFVELDYSNAFASLPFNGADASAAQVFLSAGKSNDLRNPDGRDGVSLHLDIGQVPTNPADSTLFGSWGGSNAVPNVRGCDPDPTNHNDYGTASITYRSAVRQGVFRYGLMLKGHGGGKGGGQAFCWTGDSPDRQIHAMAHELGHTIGLQHWGPQDCGRPQVNCIPPYHSIMNYAYLADTSVGYSQGDFAAGPYVNPAYADETAGISAGLTASNAFLHWYPFHLGVSGNGVDWNRDTVFGDSQRLRAAVTFPDDIPGGGCAALIMNQDPLATNVLATPALTKVGNRLYVFYVGTDGKLRYRQGLSNGPAYDGSCTGGSAPGNTCMTWGGEIVVPTVSAAKNVTVYSFSGSLMVAYTRSTDSSIQTLWTSTFDASGNASSWSAELPVNATTDKDPALVGVVVDPSRFGGVSMLLEIMYLDKVSGVYAWAYSNGVSWVKAGNVAGPGGGVLVAAPSQGPALVTLGNGQTCGAFADAARKVQFGCYDTASNSWLLLTTVGWTAGKPGIAFHFQRYATGGPINNDATRGQIYITTTNDTPVPWMAVSSTVSATAPVGSGIGFAHNGSLGNEWLNLVTNTGVALYEDPSLGALKGAMVIPASNTLKFLPLADGSFNVNLSDVNDFRGMEAGICRAIRDSNYCGDATATYWGM